MCRGGVIHVSQQTLYAQGISEVRKTGHKGIISHQICRTCLRPAMWAVRVLKVVDSSQNSQGLRSEHNFCMVFAHLEAQPEQTGRLSQVSGRQQEWQNGDLDTAMDLRLPVQDAMILREAPSQWAPDLPSCRSAAVVQRKVNKSLLRGEALFFSLIHKEKS